LKFVIEQNQPKSERPWDDYFSRVPHGEKDLLRYINDSEPRFLDRDRSGFSGMLIA